MMLPWQKNCTKCAFCIKAWRSEDDGQEKMFSITNDNREDLRNQQTDFIRSNSVVCQYLKCYHNQWNEAVSGTDVPALRKKLPNKKCSHFYSADRAEDMLLPAIVKEQERSKQNDRYYLTLFLTFVAAAASLIGVFK